METPIVTTAAAKPDVQKPAAKPVTPAGRGEARAGEPEPDRAALSARSHAAAARARAGDATARETAGRVRLGHYDPPPRDREGAEALARETSRQIVVQPRTAARAQANHDAAGVLAMLQ